MADVAPLRPLRYSAADLGPLVAPPYDVISPEQRREIAARSPHNVVHLELPEAPEGETAEGARYQHAAALLARFRDERVLVRDEEPAFYRYEQTFAPPGGGATRTRAGFLGLVRAVPFADRVVLPHERTLSGPKQDRLALFRATGASISPGFLLYRDPARALDAHLASGAEIAAFTTPDGIRHRLAKVAGREAIDAVVRHLAGATLLVADGHHRYETALAYGAEVDAELARRGLSAAPRPEHRYALAFFCNEDDPGLVVYPTHRLVHGLASFDWERLLGAAGALFEVARADGADAASLARRLEAAGRAAPTLAAIAPGGRAALLSLRDGADLARHPTLGARPEVLRRTGVALLHAGVLEHLLGISLEAQAAKTNLVYVQNPSEVARRLDAGEGQVGFLLNATPVADVRAVAEAGEVMPQKSTFFYPKIPTGLVLHTLDPARSV